MRPTRHFPVLFAALLALPLAAQNAETPLRIGSWNLEFLGDPANHRDKLPPRDDADFAAIGAYVKDLGVAVLAVQEICGEPPLRKVAAGAGPSWQCVLGTTGGWDDGVTAQNIGFLYDTARVDLLWCEELRGFPTELDGLPIFHRIPVTACFKDKVTGCDFRAVTVHLKASQKPDDLKKRKLEATVLRDWLVLMQNGKNEDQDIVVLGDFNSTYGTEPQTVLEGAGAVRYLRPAVATPTIMHFPEPIDQIAPSPRFTEIDAASFTVRGPKEGQDREAWRKTYSDHFPVTVTLRASGDDDPTAEFSRADVKFALPKDAKETTATTRTPSGGRARSGTERGRTAAIDVGDAVEVHLLGNLVVNGRLLSELGAWVVIREVNGPTRAFPVHQVFEVRLAPGGAASR